MPHVMFVISGLNMGGVESQLTSLLEAAAPAGDDWKVTVLTITSARNEELALRLERRGVEFVMVDREASGFPRFLADLTSAIRAARPDVVHTLLSGSSGTWGRVAARLARVPHVVHSDRSLQPIKTRLQGLLEPWVNRMTDVFFTNARAIAKRLEAAGVPADRIEVVPNGVDLTRFAAADGTALRREWGVGDGELVVGYLGMLRAEKRPQLLLEALELMAEDDLPARVVFAGDGVLMDELKERARRSRWGADRILFLGVRSDIPGFLAAIDVLVLTSDTEGLPNAVIEAMAAGRPVIATSVSDVPQLVTDNGYVVEPRDAAGLAEALGRMLRLPPAERACMGVAGRRRAEAEFGLPVAAERFWRAHDRVLAGGKGAA